MVAPLVESQIHADVIKTRTVLRIAIKEHKVTDPQRRQVADRRIRVLNHDYSRCRRVDLEGPTWERRPIVGRLVTHGNACAAKTSQVPPKAPDHSHEAGAIDTAELAGFGRVVN